MFYKACGILMGRELLPNANHIIDKNLIKIEDL